MPLLPSVSLCSLSFVLLFIILVLVVLTYADKSVINGSPICCFGDEVGHAWWLDEPNLQTQLPRDMPATAGRLIVVDVNGVLLQSYHKVPKDIQTMPPECKPILVNVKPWLTCALRPDAEEFLWCLRDSAKLVVWSCCKREKLMIILGACFPNLMRNQFFTGKAVYGFVAVNFL